MAFARVGTIGTAVQGAAGAGVSPGWGTGQNRTAGNLLILCVSVARTATLPTTPSGWTVAAQVAGSLSSATVYCKIAAGSDAAPSVSGITSGVIAAQLCEYSGNRADILQVVDEVLTAKGSSSPVTATAPGTNAETGQLQILCGADRRTASRAPNDTWTSNNGTVTQDGSNNGVSSTSHYSFGSITSGTQGASAPTAVLTASVTTSQNSYAVAAATFKLASTAKSGSDSGTGTEAATPDAHLDGTGESGSGTDTASLAAGISSSESGVGTEAASVSTPPVSVSASDSGTGTDALLGIGVSGSTDSGTGSDLSAGIRISGVTESGAGTDTATALAASLSSSESGSGTDLLSGIRVSGPTDAAAGSEAATLAASLQGTQESATGSDLASLAVQAGASESGVATESATVTVQVSTSDSGAGSDGSTPPGVQVAASESAVATDLATVDQGGGAKSATDAGTGSDLASVSVQVTASESGTSTETASVLQGADRAGSESGTATESASVTVRIDANEAGSGLEGFGDLLALLQGSDAAIAAELASVRTGPLVIRPGITTREGPVLGTGLSDHGHPPTVHEGPTVGTTIADQGTGGRATDGPRLTVGVDDG